MQILHTNHDINGMLFIYLFNAANNTFQQWLYWPMIHYYEKKTQRLADGVCPRPSKPQPVTDNHSAAN